MCLHWLKCVPLKCRYVSETLLLVCTENLTLLDGLHILSLQLQYVCVTLLQVNQILEPCMKICCMLVALHAVHGFEVTCHNAAFSSL